MRRWNGWGDDSYTHPLPEQALVWLSDIAGPTFGDHTISEGEILKTIPPASIKAHPLIITNPHERLRHSFACSLPNWIMRRYGTVPRFTDGVAYPENDQDIFSLYDYARDTGCALIPYGGGTSVVGGIDPEIDGPPSLTIDLSRISKLESIDEKSQIVTFGAGVKGPMIEKQLEPYGLLLGHFPQSYELSSLGGWIATRSCGQQSLHYGRIEDQFAGGRFISPTGVIDINPYPASAAGPDLRELIMGSEGRMGIITSAKMRAHRLPEHEEYHSLFFPTWEEGVEAAREMVQAGLALSMVRLSDPEETEANLILSGHENLVSIAHNGLKLIGQNRHEKVMLLISATGSRVSVRRNLRAAFTIAYRHNGFYTGQYMGKKWQRSRFTTPYLRNTLWEHGYAIDTLESSLPWSGISQATGNVRESIQRASAGFNEKTFVFAHLSQLYQTGSSFYTTYIFRVLPDAEKMLEFWKAMKKAASESLIRNGGTITHQHGVGVDHAQYLEAEKGSLGIKILRENIQLLDPDGFMNPGKLIRD